MYTCAPSDLYDSRRLQCWLRPLTVDEVLHGGQAGRQPVLAFLAGLAMHRRRSRALRGARGSEALGENLLRMEGDASRAAHCLRFPLSSRADTLGSRHGRAPRLLPAHTSAQEFCLGALDTELMGTCGDRAKCVEALLR